MAGDIKHVVQEGDCLSKIAKHYGFTWQKVWDYGANSALKAKRKDPNILMPGDVVVVPALKEKKESKSVDQTHKFKRKKEQSAFRVRVLIGEKPVKNKQCTLVLQGIGISTHKQAETNGQGALLVDGSEEIRIPGDAVGGYLILGTPPNTIEYSLDFGSLAPFDTLLGSQQRLNNLGFECGLEDGIAGPRTRAAAREFQAKHKLKADGVIGPKTMQKLKEEYGF